VILGSIERFIGVLIEHYAGAFPLWLSPVQVVILPIADRHHEFALEVEKLLKSHDIRVETDKRNEKLGKKIREARLARTPYMIVIGDQEAETKCVTTRSREGVEEKMVALNDFVAKIVTEGKVPSTLK
jgi:threonyl-tRNA synthetase